MEKLRNPPFGHNISKLLTVAIERDIRSHCALEENQIQALHQSSCVYSNKGLEYFQLELITLPPIDPIPIATDVLIDGIKAMNLRLAKEPSGG